MSTKILARAGAVAAAALGLTAVMATPALASADKCYGGGWYQSCVGVHGTDRHVDWIKSRVSVYSKTCILGHSQVLINGRHYADSNGGKDGKYCSDSWFGKEVTTGQWNVNKDYPRGTQICVKFWWFTGTGENNGYHNVGTACATVG